MRRAIPPISETVDELKQHRRQERNVHKQQRLQMLSLLASGHAHERHDVAALRGVHRNTIGRWLASYASGGLEALLDIYVAKGKPLSLAPNGLSSIEQALRQPTGFASYHALQQWVRNEHGLDVKYKTLYGIVRTRFKTKRKVPRPSHTKTPPDSLQAFQTDCSSHLKAVIPPANTRPIRVWSQDESRFGLLTIRRRLTARGVQPIGTIQHVVEWFYGYGAVAPTTGEDFFLELPFLNADNFQIFVDAFGQAYPDSLNMVLDKSGAHTAKRLKIPDHVRLVFLPLYCPELNPIERLWRDLKGYLAWQQFSNLATEREAVADLLCAYDPQTVQSLTGYSYFVQAINALSS